MAEHFPCGILHGKEPSFYDDHGCVLPTDHDGPHEFVDRDGQKWQWETDLACECEHCMRCEGDYCTTYWRKDEMSGEVEFQSWLAVLRTAGVRAALPAATWQHDAGAYARCSFCLRYTRNPKALSHRSFLCDCGSAEGWSGSFAKPGPDARWLDADGVPAAPKATLTDEQWRAAEASADPFLRCGCGAAMPCAQHYTHGVMAGDLRQQFEAWTKRQPGDEMPLEGAQWGVSWLYSDPLTQASWVGYQGRAHGVTVLGHQEK